MGKTMYMYIVGGAAVLAATENSFELFSFGDNRMTSPKLRHSIIYSSARAYRKRSRCDAKHKLLYSKVVALVVR